MLNKFENPEHLIAIYEQYKRFSSLIISEIKLLGINRDNEARSLHNSLMHEFEKLDFSELTLEQAYRLGMDEFDDYTEIEKPKDCLILFPLWMLPVIPKHIEIRNIFGKRLLPTFKDRKLDSDHRHGMLSYGMMNYQFKYKKVLVEKHNNSQRSISYGYGMRPVY